MLLFLLRHPPIHHSLPIKLGRRFAPPPPPARPVTVGAHADRSVPSPSPFRLRSAGQSTRPSSAKLPTSMKNNRLWLLPPCELTPAFAPRPRVSRSLIASYPMKNALEGRRPEVVVEDGVHSVAAESVCAPCALPVSRACPWYHPSCLLRLFRSSRSMYACSYAPVPSLHALVRYASAPPDHSLRLPTVFSCSVPTLLYSSGRLVILLFLSSLSFLFCFRLLLVSWRHIIPLPYSHSRYRLAL